jgi:transcriptional regulator with XRE-family HTH domain
VSTRVGPLIRERRERARRSQMDLAYEVGISPRHLSFVELGKSRPSPEVIELLAQRLDLPLRERNDWLLAAGYAPRHPETSLGAEPLRHLAGSLQQLIDAHDPFPAVVIDRRWTVQLTNQTAIAIAGMVPEHARGTPTNIFRISLHPDGFAGVTRNFADWSRHLLAELEAAIARTNDAELIALADEVAGWPGIPSREEWARPRFAGSASPVLTWQVTIGGQDLELFTTLSVFAAPLDVTMSELAIEMFFSANAETEQALRGLAATRLGDS